MMAEGGSAIRSLTGPVLCILSVRFPTLPMALASSIPAGAASVEVEDWETGAPVRLDLDPMQPPVATAAALYRKWVGLGRGGAG